MQYSVVQQHGLYIFVPLHVAIMQNSVVQQPSLPATLAAGDGASCHSVYLAVHPTPFGGFKRGKLDAHQMLLEVSGW